MGHTKVCHRLLHEFIALSFGIWLGKIHLRFTIRDADNSGEGVHATFKLTFVATWQRIWVHGINAGAVARDPIRSIVAVAIADISDYLPWEHD